jgi:hypothetical protein
MKITKSDLRKIIQEEIKKTKKAKKPSGFLLDKKTQEEVHYCDNCGSKFLPSKSTAQNDPDNYCKRRCEKEAGVE